MLARIVYIFARVLIAVGIARPNHVAGYAMCISVPSSVTTAVAELVSPGGMGTDTGINSCAG